MKTKQTKTLNVDQFLRAVDKIDGQLTGRTNPAISEKIARDRLTKICKRFLGVL